MTLLDTHPHLADQWHPRNLIKFEALTRGSHRKIWWLCTDCTHEWEAKITNRVHRNSGCPNCRKLRVRGQNNPSWLGHGEISGLQWNTIKTEATLKRRARNSKTAKELPFEITIEYVWELFVRQDRRCIITGKLLTMDGKKDGKRVGNASMDRIDLTKGYVKENVQWVYRNIQQMKRNMTTATFIQLCEDVVIHQTKKAASVLPKPPKFTEFLERTS